MFSVLLLAAGLAAPAGPSLAELKAQVPPASHAALEAGLTAWNERRRIR